MNENFFCLALVYEDESIEPIEIKSLFDLGEINLENVREGYVYYQTDKKCYLIGEVRVYENTIVIDIKKLKEGLVKWSGIVNLT